MSEFIVLGLIPGTHVQVTFSLWVIVVSSLSFLTLVWLAHRVRLASTVIVTLSLFALTHRRLQA